MAFGFDHSRLATGYIVKVLSAYPHSASGIEDHFFVNLLFLVHFTVICLPHFLFASVEAVVVEWQCSPLAKYFGHIHSRPPGYGIVRRVHPQ